MFKLHHRKQVQTQNSKIAANASMLMFLQIASYIVPFLLLPYLSRVLGAEAFGELSLLWAISAYLGILVDFGFYLWAVKECALIKDDKTRLSKLYSSVTLIKVALSLALLLPTLVISVSLDSSVWLYLFMWMTIVAQTLLPVWLYQGSQKVFGYLVFSIIAQISTAIATFLLVQSADALVFVTASSAFSWGIIAYLSNRHVQKEFGITLQRVSFEELKIIIAQAWHIFIANVAISYYVNLPALMVGLLCTKLETGQFMGAQKLIFAIQALITPLSASIFPITSALSKRDIKEANDFVKKLILYTVAVMFVGVNILGFFADDIVRLVLGSEYQKSAKILAIMSIGPLFVALSVIISNHILIVRGHAERLKSLYFIMAIIATLLSYPLIRDYHGIGAAWLYVIIEAGVFAGLVWVSRDIMKEMKRA